MNQPAILAPTLGNGELFIVASARLMQNIAYRIIYPLTPFLALRLGVSLGQISLLITMQVAASLLSPLGGMLSARSGQRATMSLGMIFFILGTGLCALSTSFVAFFIGYALIGLAVSLYNPAAQSYLSARTPYARRGWALSLYEVSWAAAALLGVAPLMYLVGRTQQPSLAFAILACGGMLTLGLVRAALPPARPQIASERERFSLDVLRLPGVGALLVLFFLILFGADTIFVVQSIWLNTRFGANEAAVGAVAAVQGVAGLLGSVGAAVLVDRIGKRRSVMLGYALMGATVLLLPLTAGNWLLFLPIFFLFDLGFEFGIVASFPLASGVAPSARSAVLSLCVVAIGIGRTFGTLSAEPLWRGYGFGANAVLTAVLVAVGLAVCVVFVRENE